MIVTNTDIIKLIAETLKCNINSVSDCAGLGHHPKWDSLGHMMIMSALESKYKIVINENNIGKLLSVNGIFSYLNEVYGRYNG